MKIKLFEMKKVVFLLFTILLTTSTIVAQQQMQLNRQKVKALKTAYLTEALDLKPREAEKFWPVYNLYSDKIQKLRMQLEGGLQREIKFAGGVENLSENDAKTLIDKSVVFEQQMTDNKIKLVEELSKIISAKKIVMLKKAEKDFNRRILQEYGKRRRLQE